MDTTIYANGRNHSPVWMIALVAVLCLGMNSGRSSAPITLGGIVDSDGSVHFVGADGVMCGGWQIMLDPLLRARFVATDSRQGACPAESARRTASYWDDEMIAGGSRLQVRTMAVSRDDTYVTGRFELGAGDEAVSGILRWSARTGSWSVVSSTTRSL